MGVWSFLTRSRTDRIVARIGGEVAQRSYQPVLDRVRRRTATMRIAEARGYVRARALEIVHRELAAVHDGPIQLEPALQTAIISQATEAVVVHVLAELRSVPKAATRPIRQQAA